MGVNDGDFIARLFRPGSWAIGRLIHRTYRHFPTNKIHKKINYFLNSTLFHFFKKVNYDHLLKLPFRDQGMFAARDQDSEFHVDRERILGEVGRGEEEPLAVGRRAFDVEQARLP
jgi:hypothetical protein